MQGLAKECFSKYLIFLKINPLLPVFSVKFLGIFGTFTMTDLSSLGVKEFLPVVNKDQGAILGVCSMSENSKTFNLVLGFDHRIMDGMYAAQFLKAVEDSVRRLSS